MLVFERPYGQYMWFWPEKSAVSDSWSHKNPYTEKSVQFRFAPARFDTKLGMLAPAGLDQPNALMYVVSDAQHVAALPEKCPCCQVKRWQPDGNRRFFASSVESPIRGLRTGLTATSQLVADRIATKLSDRGKAAKMIVFTDSRDDASDVAAGLELNHFRDLIRQLVFRALADTSEFSLKELQGSCQKLVSREPLSDEEQLILERAERIHPEITRLLRLQIAGMASEDELRQVLSFEAKLQSSDMTTWPQLVNQVERGLVELGVNPRGPAASLQEYDGAPWHRFYPSLSDFKGAEVDPESADRAQQVFRRALAGFVAEAIFDKGGRDLETIGVASLIPTVKCGSALSLPEDRALAIVANTIRILGQNKLYVGSRKSRTSTLYPRAGCNLFEQGFFRIQR